MLQYVNSGGVIRCKDVTTTTDANGNTVITYSEPLPLDRCNGLFVSPAFSFFRSFIPKYCRMCDFATTINSKPGAKKLQVINGNSQIPTEPPIYDTPVIVAVDDNSKNPTNPAVIAAAKAARIKVAALIIGLFLFVFVMVILFSGKKSAAVTS